MKRKNVHLTDREWELLELESQYTGLSHAEIIRRAIDVYFDNQRKVKVIDRAIAELKASDGWPEASEEGAA